MDISSVSAILKQNLASVKGVAYKLSFLNILTNYIRRLFVAYTETLQITSLDDLPPSHTCSLENVLMSQDDFQEDDDLEIRPGEVTPADWDEEI